MDRMYYVKEKDTWLTRTELLDSIAKMENNERKNTFQSMLSREKLHFLHTLTKI
jgi:hypothetical protein